MSSLIKSSALQNEGEPVRPFAFPVAARTPEETPREALLEARIAELEAELGTMDDELPRKLQEARDAGASEALEQRSDTEAQALEALAQALEEAQASWRARLAAWESAACGIAKASLEQVFTRSTERAALVEAAIARRLERVDSASIVCIRVSEEDFGDGAALSRAAKVLGAGFAIERDPTLKSGCCIFDLKLGHIDVSPGAQWHRLAQLLDKLERESHQP